MAFVSTPLSSPVITQIPLFIASVANNNGCSSYSQLNHSRSRHSFKRSPYPIACVPPSSSSSPVVDDDISSSNTELPGNENIDTKPSSSSGCMACGRESIEMGCNGEGRIQGGIATVPGFGWWPIKAYRPCPGFLASGGRYKRQGQSMDQVVSGGNLRPKISDNKNKGINAKKLSD